MAFLVSEQRLTFYIEDASDGLMIKSSWPALLQRCRITSDGRLQRVNARTWVFAQSLQGNPGGNETQEGLKYGVCLIRGIQQNRHVIAAFDLKSRGRRF